MLIDIHAHAYRVSPPNMKFSTLPELLHAQERLGIDVSFLLPIVNPEIYIPQNTADIIDMANQYPDRIVPFCNVDPRAITNDSHAPLENVLQFYKDQGCKGVGEVMPNMRMDDPKVQNLFRACELNYTEAFVKEFEDRLYFGTDLISPGMTVPQIEGLNRWRRDGVISEAAYRKITHENAMRQFNL